MSTFGTKIAYRLEVEGLEIQPVTDRALEQTLADGRRRLAGMTVDGMTLEEEIDPVHATVEAGSMTVTVVDNWYTDEWTSFFVRQPGNLSWLTDAVTASGSTFSVMSTASFTAGDQLFVGSETVEVDSVTNGTTMECTRGVWWSTAQAHYVGVGAELSYPMIGNRPASLTGRRARLFRYDDTADPQGEGTQIWLGVIATDAQLSAEGTSFSFAVDPIASILDVDLGSDKDGTFSVRGISYLQYPFHAYIRETTGVEFTSDPDPARTARLQLPNPESGFGSTFYETQQDFVAALQDEILDAMDTASARSAEYKYSSASTLASSSRGEAVTVVADEETGAWGIRFKAGGTPRWCYLSTLTRGTERVEGVLRAVSVDGGVNAEADVANGDVREMRAGFVRAPSDGDAKLPRGRIGWGGDVPDSVDPDALLEESWPGTFHLDRFAVAAEGDAVTIRHGDRLVGTFPVADYVPATQRLKINGVFSPPIFFGSTNPPELTIHRRYVLGGTVADMIRRLCQDSPALANLGGMPLLTGGVSFTVDYDNEANGPFTVGFPQPAFPVRFGNGALGWIVRGVDNGTTGTLEIALKSGNIPADNDTITQRKAGGGLVTADCDGNATPVTDGDIADVSKIVEQAAEGRGFSLSRQYQSSSAINLMEMLSHELRLLGCFLRMEASGRLTVQQARLPVATQRADFEVTASTLVTDESPPQWERQALGSLGSVEIKTGYDPVEDEHVGRTYLVRDVSAFSRNKKAVKLEVEPRSSTGIDPEMTPEQAVDVGQRLLAIYGRPYSTVTLEVDARFMSTALCGSIGKITTHRIPNVFTGERGVTEIRGLVVARSWDLARGRGILTMITSDVDAGGYTPSAWIESSTAAPGPDQYDLELNFSKFGIGDSLMPDGGLLSDFYEPGYLLSVWEWDTASQTAQKCTVDAVDDENSELRVTFASAPTLTGTRYVTFSDSDEPGMEDTTQRTYAFIADTSGLVDFGGAEQDNAKVYS